MSGVRVSWLPNNCQEKDIKIHFSKRENGGGQIQNIFYPMLNGDAVIIFEDDDAADGVLSVEDHKFNNTNFVGVTKLPSIQAFPVLEAKLDPAVAVLLQTERKLRDEIQYKFYNENVEFIKDEDDNIVGLRGNWYLLEWTWAYIDNVIKRQHGDMSGSQRTLFTETQRQDYRDELAEAPMISLPSSEVKIPPDCSVHHKGTENVKVKGAGADKTKHKKHEVHHDHDIGEAGMAVYEPEDEPSPPTDRYTEPVGAQTSDLDIVVKGSTDDVCSLEFTFGSLTVNVFVGSITKAETDVIVNAAMGPLIHGAGVAYAIAKAASPEMERQCKDYVAKHGAVEEGEVMHTCAGGDLSNQVKYIIHAVGPIWSGAYPDRSSALLTRTFLNSLKYANDHLKVNSMTMPLISSGIFGMPLELCVQSFLNAIVLFRDDCDSACLSEVNLVNNNPDNTAMTVLHLRNLISQGADKLIADAQLLLQSASTSYTTHNRGGRQRDEEDDSTYSTTGTSDRYVMPVRGQKLSSETSPGRRTVDVEDRRMTSPGGATASGGAYQYSSDRQSKPKERSPGPPTTSYAYSAEATRGLSGSTYNTTGRTTDVHTTRQSSFGNGGSLLSSGSRSFTSSSSRASTSGRPLPNTPSGVKPYTSTSSSKRY